MTRPTLIKAATFAFGALVVTLAALIANALGVVGGTTSPEPAASQPVNLRGGVPGIVVPPGTPCHNAQHVPVDSLASKPQPDQFSTPVVLPDPKLGRPADAWTCGGGALPPTVLLDNKIQITYDPAWKDVDAPAYWRDMVKQSEVGEVRDIAGLPAFFLNGSSADPTSTIMVVNKGVLYEIYGVGMRDAAGLVPVVGSVVLNAQAASAG